MNKHNKQNDPELSFTPEEDADLANLINEGVECIESAVGFHLFGENDVRDLFDFSRYDGMSRADVLALVLHESICETVADYGQDTVTDVCPEERVERSDDPACAEATLTFCGRRTCVHLVEQPDGACVLSVAFLGRCVDPVGLSELQYVWQDEPLAGFLGDVTDCERGDPALVISGRLPADWCDHTLKLRLSLKNILGYIVDPAVNQVLLSMIDCFAPA